MNTTRMSDNRQMFIKRTSTSSTASSSTSSATTPAHNMTTTSRKPMRQKILESFKKNDELSITSETSSLGSKMQIPHGFLLRNKNSSNSKPAQVFPTNARSSSSSREMLRQEAKVQRLVLQAKKTQEASVMRQMHDPRVVQKMSVKLPAASSYQEKPQSKLLGGLISSVAPFLKQETKQRDTVAESSTPHATSNGFRDKTPWISSAANSFVREEQRRNREALHGAGPRGRVGGTKNSAAKNHQAIVSRSSSPLVALPEEDDSSSPSPSSGKNRRSWKTCLRLPNISPRSSRKTSRGYDVLHAI